jgi:hypothetical protein
MTPMKPMKPMAPMQPMKSVEPWWPPALGDSPDSVGGQNDFRYAYFGRSHRLALQAGAEQVRVYDTTGHAISGAHQEQGTGRSRIVLSTADGELDLSKLQEVSAG